MSKPQIGFASIDETMQFLNVCRTTAYAMIADRQLPSVKIRNARRVPWAALHKLADDAIHAAAAESK